LNHTPWQEDWFEDNEDMQALRTSIITIHTALTVSIPRRVVVCLIVHDRSVADDFVVLWQSLAERAKGWADLLKNAAEREQWIVNLERELKEVREATAADKNKLKDEHAEEKRKAVEATAQFNTAATGRSNPYPF
jgi:hypothetical protein